MTTRADTGQKPIDFSKIGERVDKDSPMEGLLYLKARGWTAADIKAVNMRLIDGDTVRRLWPFTKKGEIYTRDDGSVANMTLDKEKGSAYQPLFGLVLPDTADETYGLTRVFYQVGEIGKSEKEPQKFLSPAKLSPVPYVARCLNKKDLLDPNQLICFVEGNFKAVIAAYRKLLCVGVNGCHGAKEPDISLFKNATPAQARAYIRADLHKYLLPGRRVALLADADVQSNLNVRKALLDFMDAVAIGFGCRPVFIELPDLGDGKSGIDDFYAAGYTRKDFDKLPMHERDSSTVSVLRCALMDLTEMGLADRFVALHGENHRHDPALEEWISYDDSTGYVASGVAPHRAMVQVVKGLPLETAAAKGADAVKARKKFQDACGRATTVNHALSLAAKDAALEIDGTTFDVEADLLGMKNGILRLSTGKLLPWARDLKVTKSCGCAFDEKAKVNEFKEFMTTLVNGDADLLRHLQEVLGAALLGRSIRTTIHMFYGPKRTGKTTLIEIMLALLGEYGLATKPELLLRIRHDTDAEKATPFLVALRGRRLIVCSELNENKQFNDALLKDMTGGDTMTGRGLNESPITFKNTAVVWLRGNHLPLVGTDAATLDRVCVEPIMHVVENPDKELGARIIANELPGVLNWVLVGMQRYVARGCEFMPPLAVKKMTEKMQSESDLIGMWLADKYEVDMTKRDDPWREDWLKVRDSFKEWRADNGHKPISARTMMKALRERFGFAPDDETWPLKSNSQRFATGFRALRDEESQTLVDRLLHVNEEQRKELAARPPRRTGPNRSAESARIFDPVVPITSARRKR